MLRASSQFADNIRISNEIGFLHDYLYNTLKLPNDLSDLLRMQWIYAVSALDKLIHELVRIGMLESFNGSRPQTSKFNAFTFSFSTYENMLQSIPPPEFWFEQEVVQKHKILSFQDPDKITDALSLIWMEEHKWQKIASVVGVNQNDVKTKLRNIVSRRNQMVHEADINPSSGTRNDIDVADVQDVVKFIGDLGRAVASVL